MLEPVIRFLASWLQAPTGLRIVSAAAHGASNHRAAARRSPDGADTSAAAAPAAA